MKILLILLLTGSIICKGQEKLEIPVNGGHFRPVVSYINRPVVKDIYLYPDQNHEVRSAELGDVKTVAYVDSNNFLVLVIGKHNIYYSNLDKTFVKTGDKL